MAKSKTVVKSGVVESSIATAMDKLATACTAGDRAVAARSKSAKQNTSLVKRLGKRRASLSKRKQSTKKRLAKSPSAKLRRELAAVTRELATTTKELTKARAAKASNAAELAALKQAQRRANAYQKAIQQADRALGKKKRRRR